MNKKVLIIGAGPSGLAAGYELSKNGFDVVILEKNGIVGGLARTVNHNGYLFDVGPHRFFTKSNEVKELWHKILNNDFLAVPRLTRIYYQNKFFSYPVKPFEVLFKLGIAESFKALFSYLKAKISLRDLNPSTFEEWITKNFGRRLFKIFFKTYTEKVWGIPCNEIEAEWAGQRIKNLSFLSAILSAFGLQKNIKSLVEEFNYPRFGAGMMYEKMAEEITARDGKIVCNQEISKIEHNGEKIISAGVHSADYFLSSMPITEFVKALIPPAPEQIQKAAENLYYRSHITVNFVVNRQNIFPDNWIYIHDPKIKMARLSSYTNFSKEMSGQNNKTLIACEYFVFENEEIWKKSDEELKNFAEQELQKLGFVSKEEILDWFVLRHKFAYPAYFKGYKNYLEIIRSYLENFKNFQSIGRGGMYRYNNMDHAILTGLLAAKNIMGENHNLWQVNAEYEYHEEKRKL